MKIITERLVGYSDLVVENGHLVPKKIRESVNFLNLKPRTGQEEGFVFYDKDDQNILICHVGITTKRERFEVSYGTEESFRENGYMLEALNGLIDFIFSKTNEKIIWAIPNGEISQHILEKCGFRYFVEENGIRWFALERGK